MNSVARLIEESMWECTRREFSIHGLVCVSLLSFGQHVSSLADDPAPWRRYRDGPLTAADFRAQPPALRKLEGGRSVPLTANTFFEIHYDSRYQITLARGRWTARLTSAEAFAIVHQDKSWNIRPQDARLMDHEQGHFDLAHSYAIAVQLHLNERRKAGKLPIGRGETSDAALRSLEDKLRGELQPIFDEHLTAQKEYDRITDHGILTEAQKEQRTQHASRIAELQDKLTATSKKNRK